MTKSVKVVKVVKKPYKDPLILGLAALGLAGSTYGAYKWYNRYDHRTTPSIINEANSMPDKDGRTTFDIINEANSILGYHKDGAKNKVQEFLHDEAMRAKERIMEFGKKRKKSKKQKRSRK